MPRQRNVKYLCCETLLFMGIFVGIAHMGVNVWERYLMQQEITNMKTSLHTLKITVNNIGYAYDRLNNELTLLVNATKQYSTQADAGQKHFNKLPISIKTNLDESNLIIDVDVQNRKKNFNKDLFNALENAQEKNDKCSDCSDNIHKTDKNSDQQEILMHSEHQIHKNISKEAYCEDCQNKKQEKKVSRCKSQHSPSKQGSNIHACISKRKSNLKNATTMTRYPLKSVSISCNASEDLLKLCCSG